MLPARRRRTSKLEVTACTSADSSDSGSRCLPSIPATVVPLGTTAEITSESGGNRMSAMRRGASVRTLPVSCGRRSRTTAMLALSARLIMPMSTWVRPRMRISVSTPEAAGGPGSAPRAGYRPPGRGAVARSVEGGTRPLIRM